MLNSTLYIKVGRKGFGSINLKIWMVEGRVIKALLYLKYTLQQEMKQTDFLKVNFCVISVSWSTNIQTNAKHNGTLLNNNKI